MRIEIWDDGFLKLCVTGWAIPPNAILRECYETDTEIVVCGQPKPNDASHNCDEMGCSSVSHVLYRFPKK